MRNPILENKITTILIKTGGNYKTMEEDEFLNYCEVQAYKIIELIKESGKNE